MYHNKLAVMVIISATFLLLGSPIYSQTQFYNEAPMLTESVAAGVLPPVDERLPNNPMLVTPQESVGIYGGTWNMAMVGQDFFFLHRTLGYENLLRWNERWTRFAPNVAQSIETSADSTTFTVHLREGMRWSDGMPFTSADIVFWYEAVYLNPLVTHWFADTLSIGPDLTVTAPSDYEVVFQFDQPNGLFLQRLASLNGGNITHMPRHYLAQFHADYNPDVAQLVAESGFEDWATLFAERAAFQTPYRPTLFAWMVESTTEEGIRAIRNPYYWKVDTDFNQLPYIDAVEFAIVETKDDMLPLIEAGEIDMQDRNLPAEAIQALPADYQRYDLLTAYSNYMAISLNLTHPDPAKRALFQNRDFRIGLSHAINRPAIIEATGLDVQARQVAPLEGTALYNEQMVTQYLAYDVALANEYLDRTGYTERDAEGNRLGPDGQAIRLTFLSPTPVPGAKYDLHLAQIQSDWRAVGVDLQIETLPREDARLRWVANDFDVSAWVGEGGYDIILEPRYYIPTNLEWSHYAIPWARWHNAPLNPLAEEPPPALRDSLNRYRQILRTADFDQQTALMAEIIATAADEFLTIGIHEMPITHGIVRSNFHNVPDVMFLASNYLNPAPTNPSQYYIDPQIE